MIDPASTVLQVVALTLPAVALYMGVLNDLYEEIDQAKQPRQDPNSPAFERSGPVEGKIDIEVDRAFVTYTTLMEGIDFKLSVFSLIFLLLGAIVLTVSLIIELKYIFTIGIGCAILGFGFLVAALCYTAYASFKQLYPIG
jgi:hypothetical protein